MTHTQTPGLKYGGTTIGSSGQSLIRLLSSSALSSVPKTTAQTTAQSFLANVAHVFPDQSRMHMQLVGVGNGEQTTWALVKSGYQVLPVQMDQYLGSEKVKIKYANAQGLWGEVAEGVVQKLLTWEAGKP